MVHDPDAEGRSARIKKYDKERKAFQKAEKEINRQRKKEGLPKEDLKTKKEKKPSVSGYDVNAFHSQHHELMKKRLNKKHL